MGICASGERGGTRGICAKRGYAGYKLGVPGIYARRELRRALDFEMKEERRAMKGGTSLSGKHKDTGEPFEQTTMHWLKICSMYGSLHC